MTITRLVLSRTADLDTATLTRARDLLDTVFDGDFSEHDWEHTIGGVHAIVWEGDDLVGHASVVPRQLTHQGLVLRTGYVEGVGVRADRRGWGHGATLMAAAERVVREQYELGALSSSDEALDFYAARGWQRWCGPTSVLTPTGTVRTEEDDGGVYVLPVTRPLDVTGDLVCDWREGDVW
ncbi:GNAT family N-acetyltransferase [Marinitenerispora sediminis]|uniref:Aminoglycoside 2'-N-acetyltransferase n=1 Tax=Marinitenerispora sediminis TaxID=1931232 RepID=A0A368TAA0_9ACTN|nr:GNAT family N-acetyltransferase [Marinitenerispora sediminis]RCV52981.1 aminoglycoside 2'-N-acetyltransferase [Marinitenerispora sediminis]RCV58451.1 aminoglycoside 2'-N-acetyltransferase [Marinitenerispora sediminis]RCV61823.1 aminoglycoside 2'-N-acetyltransferase [Marinitenerispora sediminis]